MAAFEIEVEPLSPGRDLLRVGFGDAATGEDVVAAICTRLDQLGLKGGHLALVNGGLSIAGAMAMAHHLAHLYGVVAVFDPKRAGYIVAISHDPDFIVGGLIPDNKQNP